MKRYKLKKDLPTFKAGEEFHISLEGNLIADSKDIIAYAATTLREFPNILTDWFEEIPEDPKTVWDLGVGDDAWFISGGIRKFVSMDEIELAMFQDRAKMGDGFATLEEAEQELAHRMAKQILLRDTNGYRPDLKDNHSPKHYVYYDIDDACLKEYGENYAVEDRIYFASREDAEASIKSHREEWLTYFGIED